MNTKPKYLPACWDVDYEMSGFMSALKIRQVNPTNYDRIIDFWRKLIDDYCRCEKKCLIDYDELKYRFKRGNQLPAPLANVLEELYNSQILVPIDELSSPQQKGWLQWGASLITKSSWLTGARPDFQKTKFVHIPTLKTQAKELLNLYKVEYETTECSDVVEYMEFKARCGSICDPNSFDLVLDELIRQGEVSEGTSENGERILKFKDQSSRGPAKFTRADASVHELRKTMAKIDSELRRIEQRVKKCDQEAREAVHRKDKTAALQALRKKKRAEKEMQDKDVQYQRLVGMFEQLASSKQTREILDAYKSATRAYKEALERQGLTIDKVDDTMDSIHDAIQDANDIDAALKDGFKGMPMPSSQLDDMELESELDAIMAEENVSTKRAGREPQLPELPTVPTGRPTDTDDVAVRLRRLREGFANPS